jgi:hypothetical protein
VPERDTRNILSNPNTETGREELKQKGRKIMTGKTE